MNVRVGCIARRQAIMGRFALEASPPPPLLVASDSEDDDDASDDDVGDASSTDEMST